MRIERFCLQCGELLPEDAPVNKQYCNDACKQSAYRERSDDTLTGTQEDEAEEMQEGNGLLVAGLLGLGLWMLNAARKKS
ncbi:hypothetical protein JYG30_06255 [Fibrella sp. USSR17]